MTLALGGPNSSTATFIADPPDQNDETQQDVKSFNGTAELKERSATPVTVTHFSSDKNGIVEKIILPSPNLSSSKKLTNLTFTELSISNDLITLDPISKNVNLSPKSHTPDTAEERLSELVSSNPFGNPFNPDPFPLNPFQNEINGGPNPFLDSLGNPFTLSSPRGAREDAILDPKSLDVGRAHKVSVEG